MLTLERDIEVFRVARVIDPVSLKSATSKPGVGQNGIGEVVLATPRPVVFDIATDIPTAGRFVLLDGYDVVGGGIIRDIDQ